MSGGGIAFSPLLPWPFLLAAGAVGIVLIAAIAWRRGRGWLARALTIAMLLAAIGNPRFVSEEREARPDVAVVVVDRSLSQSIAGRAGETSAAEASLRTALADLSDLEVRFATAGGPGEDRTRVFAALEQVLADTPRERLAGVVVVTDGQIHDAPKPELLPPGVPLHALLVGRPDERDRRLRIDEAPAYGIVGGTLTIAYTVVDAGAVSGGTEAPAAGETRAGVTVRINGEPVGKSEVRVGERQTLSVRLDRAGPTAIEAAVEAAPGEISTLNNQAALTVNGVRDKLRVLLVSGQPHPGERAWRNLLKSDAAVELVHFTILRPPEKEELTPLRELSLIVFPVQELFERRLYDFDLVVFDRFIARGVLAPEYLSRVADYLRRGGAVLLAAGPEFAGPQSLYYTTLGEAMAAAPTGAIVEQAFRPRVSDLGQRHPITSALPGERVSGDAEADEAGGPAWGRWFRLIETEVRRGSVLMEGPEARPLLVVDRVGEGRLAQLASDQIWLWGRGFDGGGPQGELSRRLVHWLMKEPELEEERLSATFADGRLRIERRTLSTEPIAATVTSPTGAQQTVVLDPGADGVARGEAEAGEAGLYRIEDPAQATWAATGAVDPPELADLRATAGVLAPVAEVTGGGIAWLGDGLPRFRRVELGQASAGRGWMGLSRNNAYTVTGACEVPLLPALLLLAAVLAPLAAAWWR
ncbi:MAG TPA: hypothetical protein VLR47_05230, partial [Rhodospirillales bacterium]|nr:hypothetical protein [Rhodospirillales bacterium]